MDPVLSKSVFIYSRTGKGHVPYETAWPNERSQFEFGLSLDQLHAQVDAGIKEGGSLPKV